MRDSMVIYRSMFMAIRRLPLTDRGEVMDAIMAYGFDGVMYNGDNEIVATIFELIKPQIDANNRKFENGKKGGNKRTKAEPKPNQDGTKAEPKPNQDGTKAEPKPNQDGTKAEPKPNQDGTKAEPNVNANANANANVNVNEFPPIIPPTGDEKIKSVQDEADKPKKRKEKSCAKREIDLSGYDLSPAMEEIVKAWLEYKQERGEPYKPRGVGAFITRLVGTLSNGDEDKAREIVERSIANNYSGVFPIKTTIEYVKQNDAQTTQEFDSQTRARIARRLASHQTNEMGRDAGEVFGEIQP